MSDHGELEELCTRVAERGERGEQVEAFGVHRVGVSVDVYEGDVETLAAKEGRGIGVRVIREGRLGFASTSDVSAEGLDYALREARVNTQFVTTDVGNALPGPQHVEPLDGIYVEELQSLSTSRRVELALELERLAGAADSRVSAVKGASYGDALVRVAIASSTGVRASYARSDVRASVSVLAGDGDDTHTGFGITNGRSIDDLDLVMAASEAAERSTRLLGARKPATRAVPVVFDPFTAAEFLGIVVGAFSADAVQKGRSLFVDKLGEHVAAARLSIVDDGRLLDGAAAAPCDDEGVATQRTVLVQDGVMQSLLYDTTTALRGGARSTGNATRSGFGSPPAPAPSNVFFDGPALPPDDIIRRAEGGLYVQDLSGVHSGVNPVSGEFSVGVTGTWIRGGELADAVREATVASTILEMLHGVVALGDDRRFLPFGAAGATLAFGEMTVAGS